ncbi:MAG: M3 family metallopeptidase, partial [Bdellovibrionales bacterium]
VSPLILMKNVSTSEDTRKESQDCSQLIAEFTNDVGTRRELYLAIKDQKGRNSDEKRLHSEALKDFEHNGMKLSDENLKKFRELSDKLSNLQLAFGNNIRNDNTEVLFTAEELTGVRADYLNELKKNDKGLYRVPTREPDFLEVMQKVPNADARKKMITAFYNRGGDANIKLLEQAILVREEIAKLLGFKTWADYKISDRMAKTSSAVMTFLNGLRGQLSAQNKIDIAELLKFKQEIEPGATVVNQWDIPYLSYQLQSKRFQINLDQVREYFPADVVIPGMLQVYSDMLGVKFKEMPQAKVWAPEVKQYAIHDKKDDRLIGFFYLDLYGRPGKYTHAACANVISGRRMKDGKYNYPISVIYANLSSPTKGKPSLLTYADRGEVVTLFHEFGHAMHGTLTRAPYASLAGTNVKRDFVEAPSQMLENWVYRPEILDRLSGHYLDHAKKIPADMQKTLIALKDFQQARIYTRQLLLGTFDMTINMQNGPVDTLKTYETLYHEITSDTQMPGIKFPASFGHLMGGYDAGYYGYLWSKVYAEDMFTIFDKAGVTSPAAGLRYRTTILERGNMEEPMVLVKKFLGREPNSKAFLKSLGVKN